MWSAGRGDDEERFLADLRALRDTAALGYDELAARAHYPSDILKAAENGPSLPGLPILAAYVRACDGDVPEWEERWRGLGYEVRAGAGLPVRPAGASPAAVAGARAAVGIAPPDVYDPDRIRAALRGRHGYPDQAAAVATRQESAGVSGTDPAAQGTGMVANGHHHGEHRDPGLFGTAVTETTDHAGSPGTIRRDPYSASRAQDSQPASPSAESGSAWPDRAQTESPPASQDAWLTSQDPADSERTWRLDTGQMPTGPAVPPPAPAPPSESRQDRLYPLRLLVVIVVAALIGSILVMLIR